MLTRAGYWLIDFGLLLVLWFLLTDKLAWHEAWVGLGAAALGAGGTEAVRATEHPRFFPHFSWILQIYRLPGQILKDNWAVTRKLAAMLFRGDTGAGTFVTTSFRSRGNSSREIARRALAVAYGSISPDSIVIAINRVRNRLLVHLLTAREAPQILRILERRR